jgi:hypothetical protein
MAHHILSMIYIDLAVVVALVLLNGLLALAELALVSSRRSRLQVLVDRGITGSRRARLLSRAIPVAFCRRSRSASPWSAFCPAPFPAPPSGRVLPNRRPRRRARTAGADGRASANKYAENTQ